MSECNHKNTKICEPHLAGARKCTYCDMVYNPNYIVTLTEDNDALVQARVPKKYVNMLKAKGIKIPSLIRSAIKAAALDK